jgi:hypothetical protein
MEPIKLEEYEKILEDHGHKSIYYPRDIIMIKFKQYLIDSLEDELETTVFENAKKRIIERIEQCFIGE